MRIGIFENLTDSLFRFAYWRIGNKEDAEDLVQETFIRMWQNRLKIRKYDRPDSFAFKVIRNLCIDYSRKKTIKTIQLIPEININEDLLTPLRLMELKEELLQVKQELKKLPEQQQTIFFLRNVEGYEIDEIADIMGLRKNTVEVNLSRARQKINRNFNRE